MNAASDVETPGLLILERSSPEARAALEKGVCERSGRLHPVRASGLVRRANGVEEVIFQEYEAVPPRNAGERLKRFFHASRAFSLTATLMPCLAVLAEGLRQGVEIHLPIAISALLGAAFLQIATNLHNDVTDYRKLIDLPGTPGGSGVFEKGWYSPPEVLRMARITLALGVLAGIPTLLAHPLEILVLGGLGGLGALLYSNDRLGLKYHALGDLAVLGLCGPVLTLGFSFAAFGAPIPGTIELGLILGFLACALLHMNNLQDLELDRDRGAVTLAVRLGFSGSRRLLLAFYGAAFLTLVLAVLRSTLPMAALLAAFAAYPSLRLVQRVMRAIGPASPTLGGTRVAAAQIHLLTGALLVIGILASKWIEG